jgi:peptide deformylase
MQISKFDLKKLTIREYPDPILRQVAQPVRQVDDSIVELVERMTDLMLDACGIGLAAPQVGISLRILLMCPDGKRENVEVFINPQVSGFEGFAEMEEGCLSLPGIRAKVRRPAACTVAALDSEGTNFIMDAVELPATIIQHENDHLDGRLFIDRIGSVSRLACRRAIKQLERDYE